MISDGMTEERSNSGGNANLGVKHSRRTRLAAQIIPVDHESDGSRTILNRWATAKNYRLVIAAGCFII